VQQNGPDFAPILKPFLNEDNGSGSVYVIYRLVREQSRAVFNGPDCATLQGEVGVATYPYSKSRQTDIAPLHVMLG
jgi:hypothetical protein